MIKVLHVIDNINCGGAETMLVNLHRHVERSKIQFDYFSFRDDPKKVDYYEEEIKKLGGMLYKVKSLRFPVVRITNYFWRMKFLGRFLREHPEYKIIHCHLSPFSAIYLAEARKQGRIAIMHSHNMKPLTHSLRDLFYNFTTYFQRFTANYFIACSKKAGTDRFGNKVHVKLLPNGIETPKYKFCLKIRKLIRESRAINSEDTLVLGHVGRLSPVKNHKFLVDVFRLIHERIHNSKLWLIGCGLLEDDIHAQVHDYGLDNAVDFIGVTDRVNEYLMGMDVFAFPSFSEGLGMALIEAQCSGLPCIASYGIPDEGIISDRVKRLSTNSPNDAEIWADAIIEASAQRDNREKYPRIIAEAGFDIETTARELQDFYFSLVKP